MLRHIGGLRCADHEADQEDEGQFGQDRHGKEV
jgi:hypothetical protein